MNKNIPLLPFVVGATFAAAPALGQTSAEQAARLIEQPAKTELNQFRVSARLGYNISARMVNVGVPPAQTYPPPDPLDPSKHFMSATGVTYQDGYVGIDEANNFNPVDPSRPITYYYGYARDEQILHSNQGGIRDTVLLSRSSSGTILGDFKNDPQAGVEIGYSRQLGTRDGTTWGIETAFTYTSLDLRSHGIADPQVLRVDSFSFQPNSVAPLAPHPGTFEIIAPGTPPLYATPTHHDVNIVSSFDASIYGLKVGPYFEFPVAKRLSFALSGGFSLLLSDSEFRVQQSVDFPTPVIPTGTFTDSSLAVLPGAYAAGRLSLMASDKVNVFTGLQYESTGHHTRTLAGKRVDIDFWNAIYWTFGVSYSF